MHCLHMQYQTGPIIKKCSDLAIRNKNKENNHTLNELQIPSSLKSSSCLKQARQEIQEMLWPLCSVTSSNEKKQMMLSGTLNLRITRLLCILTSLFIFDLLPVNCPWEMHAIWELMQVMWEVEGVMLEDLTLVEVGGWRVGIPTESWRQQADFRGGVGIWTQTDALLNILRKEIINIFTQFAHSWSSHCLKKCNDHHVYSLSHCK